MLAGIFGQKEDIHVYTLKRRLEERGCKTIILNLAYDDIILGNNKIEINQYDLTKFDAFYVRQIPFFLMKQLKKQMPKDTWISFYDNYQKEADICEFRTTLFSSIINIVSNQTLTINPLESMFYQQLKPYQFYLLKKNNIPIPEYYVTNDERFLQKTDSMVTKPLCSYSEVTQKTKHQIIKILPQRAIIQQKLVTGRSFRASVLDDQFVGAIEIIHKSIDSRIGKTKYIKMDLPEHVIEILFKCLKILKYRYSEIDFVLNNENVHILDCNPSAGFMVLEKDAGIHTSSAIADYIIRHIR